MKYTNKPYDEAIEFSQDLSVAESYDGRDKKSVPRERKLQNDQYDEVVEMSMSMDKGHPNYQSSSPQASKKKSASQNRVSAKESSSSSSPDGVKTTSIANRPFDEALEVSQSGSDESFQSQESNKKQQPAPINNATNSKNVINNNKSILTQDKTPSIQALSNDKVVFNIYYINIYVLMTNLLIF
jgi:hypothetical protein